MCVVAPYTPNTGSFLFSPSQLLCGEVLPSNEYKIRVVSTSTPDAFGVSPGYFSILPSRGVHAKTAGELESGGIYWGSSASSSVPNLPESVTAQEVISHFKAIAGVPRV